MQETVNFPTAGSNPAPSAILADIGTFEVRKISKRLWIVRIEDGAPIYTPPDFVKIHSRQPLIDLANEFTKLLRRDIGAIVEFQTRYSVSKNYRFRGQMPV